MRTSTPDRLERLDLLESQLKGDGPLTIGGLAQSFGVSRRTLSRDIELLRLRGLPIESDRGRGGGVRLHRHWGVGRLNLTHHEAMDLLVSLAIAEQLRSPWLIANLTSIRHKLTASFSPALKSRIAALRLRILVGQGASAAVLQSSMPEMGRVPPDLFGAFVETRVVTLTYRDGTGAQTTRAVEPHLFMLNYPLWYMICWDRDRDAVRSFRVDRIAAANPTSEVFKLRPRSRFDEAIAGVDAITP